MNLCIKKAKENGIAIVSAKGSNHFGINQFYSLMATKQNLIVGFKIFKNNVKLII